MDEVPGKRPAISPLAPDPKAPMKRVNTGASFSTCINSSCLNFINWTPDEVAKYFSDQGFPAIVAEVMEGRLYARACTCVRACVRGVRASVN